MSNNISKNADFIRNQFNTMMNYIDGYQEFNHYTVSIEIGNAAKLMDGMKTFVPKLAGYSGHLNETSLIVRSIIINLFNYNFWQDKETKYPRSQELIKTIDSIFLNDDSYNDFLLVDDVQDNLMDVLYIIIESYDFKEKDKYLKSCTNFRELLKLDNGHAFMEIIREFKKQPGDEIDINKAFGMLAHFLPFEFGNDPLQKRETMILLFIEQHRAYNNLKPKHDYPLFPVDYRIPSVLFDQRIVVIKDENGEEVDVTHKVYTKGEKFEEFLRWSCYKALRDMTRQYDVQNFVLDEYLFWYAKEHNLPHHLCETMDY